MHSQRFDASISFLYMTLANVQCLDCFTCISFTRKAVCNYTPRVRFQNHNVKPNSFFLCKCIYKNKLCKSEFTICIYVFESSLI